MFFHWVYHGLFANPSTGNKERSGRKDRLCGPRYTPTLEYNKFHYTDPDSITRPTI